MKAKIKLSSLILLSLFPLYPYGVQPVVIVIATLFNVCITPKEDLINKKRIRNFIVINFWVLISIFTLIYTQNLEKGLDESLKLLSFVLITANFIWVSRGTFLKHKTIIKMCFVLSLWVALIIHEFHFIEAMYLNGFLDYLNNPFNEITQIAVYEDPLFLDFHKAYFSFNLIVGLLLTAELLFKIESKWKFGLMFIAIHFILEIVHFVSIINVLLLIPLFIVLLIKVFRKHSVSRKYATLITVVLFFITGTLGYYKLSDQNFLNKIDKLSRFFNVENSSNNLVINRKVVWAQSFKITQNHPFGVGIGDVKATLNSRYSKSGLMSLAKNNINSHNQFLHLGIVGGYLLITAFLIALFFLFRVNKENILYGFLMFALTLNLVLEVFSVRANGLWAMAFVVAVCTIGEKTIITQKNTHT